MTNKISKVIENKLKFLKLTRAGKIRLSPFSDKVLYKALSAFQRNYKEIPANPFTTYFALCRSEGSRLRIEPKWETMGEFPNYDENGAVTYNDEYYDGKFTKTIQKEFEKQKSKEKQRASYGPKQSFYKGATFEKGLIYYKYGMWYKYPDNAFSKTAKPSIPLAPSQKGWLEQRFVDPQNELLIGLYEMTEEQIQHLALYGDPLIDEVLQEFASGIRPDFSPTGLPHEEPPEGDELDGPIPDRPHQDDPRRYDLEPIEELKKSIRSGRLNKKGLKYLRWVYVKYRPELIPTIDAYLNGEDIDNIDNISKPMF